MSLLLLLKGEAGGEPGAGGGRVAVTRELPPDQLAWRVDPPQGAPSRWAADEPLAENVADDIKLSDEMPGGDKEGSTVLARNPRIPWPDLAPFSDISVYGPGVNEVGRYRLDKAPESDGDRMAIDPAAVGWKACLDDDDKSIIGPGFIDSDLSKWGELSTARRLVLSEAKIKLIASVSVGGSPVNPEDVGAAIIVDFNGMTTLEAPDTEAGEVDYDSGGIDIGSVRYNNLGDLSGGGANSDWESDISIGRTDTFGPGSISGTDHDASAASNKSVDATGPGFKFARIRNRFAAASEGAPLTRIFGWQPKVIGNHGLTPQGTWPNIGFTCSQMLGYAIPLYTPLECDPEEDLEDSGYIIGQAWFSDPGPLSQVVQELTKYELLDWFVYGKRFQLRRPGTYGRKWQAYAGPSGLQEQGEDAARSWKEIVVRWQDVDGKSYTVGPPGSGAHVETAALEVTDPDHPAVKAEEAYGPNFNRKDLLDLGGISTAARAIEVGERWLKEANLLSRSGSCTLSGYVLDDRGIMRPVSQVRAGDEIRFPDSGDSSYRRITSRSYDHNSRTTSLSLDAPSQGLSALLERLQAGIKSLAL